MSTESATLLAIQALRREVESLGRHLELVASRTQAAPDRLSTREASKYARCSSTTLYTWRDRGWLVYHEGPRPWSRADLDRCLTGVEQ